MAEFTAFTFSYGLSESNTNQYAFQYTYTSEEFEPTIYGNINGTQVVGETLGAPGTYTGTLYIDEESSPVYFAQGTTISANMSSTEGAVTSNVYGVFQRKTDSTNLYFGSNDIPKPYYIVERDSSAKSVILPPIGTNNFSPITFKYLVSPVAVFNAKPFSICAYMSNVSYPITTSVFTSTTSEFTGIFDSSIESDTTFQNIFTSAEANYCYTYINNTLRWNFTNKYTNTISISSDLTYPLSGVSVFDSNSQILYYEMNSDNSGTNNIILSSNVSYYPKYVCVTYRPNPMPNPIASITVNIWAPQFGTFETSLLFAGATNYISFELLPGDIQTVGFFRSGTGYIILSSYNGDGITASSSELSLKIITTSLVNISKDDTNLQLVKPLQETSSAMINTIYTDPSKGAPKIITLNTPENNSTNFIMIQSATARCILLSSAGQLSYTFATFYRNSLSNSVTIPLYRNAT